MKKNTGPRPHKDKTDAELAADARMVAQELSTLLTEISQRGIQFDTSVYQSGRVEIEIYRNNRVDL